MVDEFQDASRARARPVRGLVKTPGRFLMAVGDDWQSVNLRLPGRFGERYRLRDCRRRVAARQARTRRHGEER